MSPPGIVAPAAFFFSSGSSATTASVVSSRLAIEAAFCKAERVTLVGSMTPALPMSSYSPVAALKGVVATKADSDSAYIRVRGVQGLFEVPNELRVESQEVARLR